MPLVKPRSTMLQALRRVLLITAPFVLFWSVALPACRSTPSVPFRAGSEEQHATENLPRAERAELWVSYQIVIENVDGATTDYRAKEPCVYFKVALPAGEHRFNLRLDYRSPMHRVRTETPIELVVQLAPGGSYRLLDLSTDEVQGRSFRPYLLEGAPSDEKLELSAGTGDADS